MKVKFEEIIYNSVLAISILNFINLYIKNTFVLVVTHVYNFRYLLPLIFITISRNYVSENITKKKNEIVCYTSCIHASILAFFSILKLGGIIDLYLYDIVLDYSVSYNLIDIYYLIMNNSKIKLQMIFHHVVVISSILYKSWFPLLPNYYYYIALNFLSEVTTVPLNITWLLYLQKKKEIPMFKIISKLTILLYLPFRVFLNTYLLYHQIYYLDSCIKYIQGMFLVLNYYWFYKLCSMS